MTINPVIKYFCSIAFTVFILHSNVVFASPPTTLRTCLMDKELFPLWRGPGLEDAENPGLNIELYKIILRELGLKTSWVRAPFPRCLALLKNGQVDVLNAASYQKAREKYGVYPTYKNTIDVEKRLKFDTYHAFVTTTSNVSWDGQQFNHLNKHPVAIEIGASIKHMLDGLHLAQIQVPNIENAFGMLKIGRVAVVVTNENHGYKYADHHIKKLSIPIQTKPYYLMFSKQFFAQFPNLSKQIWDESKALHLSHSQKIVDKYTQLSPW